VVDRCGALFVAPFATLADRGFGRESQAQRRLLAEPRGRSVSSIGVESNRAGTGFSASCFFAFLPFSSEAELIANLHRQLEGLNRTRSSRDDGSTKNVYLIDKQHIHNNCLQVINQYEVENGTEAG
jgi:hypothetical protein